DECRQLLDDQCLSHVMLRDKAVNTYCLVVVRRELVETQAIFLELDNVQESGFHFLELRRRHSAFENAVLHTLAESTTGCRNLTQSFSACTGIRRHIIGDKDIE